MQPSQILILESQPINAKLIRYYLHRATDYRVAATASSLTQAKEYIQELKIDIVIADMFRVNTAGLSLIEWLSKNRKKVKVLALIQSSVEQTIMESIKQRVDAILHENVSLNDLSDTLEQLVQKNVAKHIDIAGSLATPAENNLQVSKIVNNLALLTSREKEILKLVLDGCSNNEIAQEMGISIRTVENHRANILRKTDGKNFFYLAKIICKNALLDIY